MFVQILNQITEQIKIKCQGQSYDFYLQQAIKVWCNQLDISQDAADYILKYNQLYEIQVLTSYIYKEGITENKDIIISTFFGDKPIKVENPFYKYINALFNRMNITIVNVKFIVLIAFGITAVGYFVYRLNQQRQQQTTSREEARQYNSNIPSFTLQTPPLQTISKQFLVLVVSALQADFIESLKAKGRINVSEGEVLYEITKYLWLGSETTLSQFQQVLKNHINQYKVSKGEESEYDIYLVYIELNQVDQGFKPDVDQIDRHDAFRKLANLAINFKTSPRLQMEAYENLEVYNR